MSRTYGKNEWREDLKTLLRKSSTPDLHMVFLFIESQVFTNISLFVNYVTMVPTTSMESVLNYTRM